MGYRGRDIEVCGLGSDSDKCIIMACDSAGGIGNKLNDIVKTTPEIVGILTARVPIMEVLAIGGSISMLSATICCEPEPTGRRICEGIKQELCSIGIANIPIAISTEKNFETSQTGLGVTIVGMIEDGEIRIGKSRKGFDVYCIGIPKIGSEINGAYDEQILKPEDIIILNELDGIGDIIPVGSGGILKEAMLMAQSAKLSLSCYDTMGIDVYKSGGPSTCGVFSCEKDTPLPRTLNVPIRKIGSLY